MEKVAIFVALRIEVQKIYNNYNQKRIYNA